MLELNEVSAGYGGLRVVRDVSLTVAAGEMVTLLGRNGAGKTTLFRAIARQIPLQGGEILFESEPIHGKEPWRLARLGIGFVPEGRQLFGSLTVLENLQVVARARGLDRQRSKDAFERAFDLFSELGDRRHHPAGKLSGGQQQMLAIARALVGDPKLLVLDEPSVGLAPIAVEQIFRTVASLRSEGRAVLLIEQHPAAVESSSRVHVLHLGRIALVASPGELGGAAAVERMYLDYGGDIKQAALRLSDKLKG